MIARCVVRLFWGTIIVFVAGTVSAQTYPSKPIRILTGGAGGNTDLAARLVAQGLTGSLGQQVIVDNRDPLIANQTVANAQRDGYTLLVVGNPLWLSPFMQKVSYDPVRDFSPISTVDRAPSILVVNPSVAAKSVKDLIALAKAKPGELNCGSGARGAGSFLAGELFKAIAGVNIVIVSYKGAAPAITGLMSNEVQIMFATAGSVTPHLKSGKLNALAVTGAKLFTLLPELPTVAASGLPGYQAETIEGIFAPAQTPNGIIDRLNGEVVLFLKTEGAREKFLRIGEEASPSSPEELAAIVKSEMGRLGKIIKDAGIRAE